MRRLVVCLACCCAAAIAVAEEHDAPAAAPGAGYNVAVLLFDTLRADHLGCYGYAPAHSPTFDRLAEEGIRFHHAYSASSYTREAVATLFTGEWPSQGGHDGWWVSPAPERTTMAEAYEAADYRTGLFSNSPLLRLEGFHAGFDEVDVVGGGWAVSQRANRLNDNALVFTQAAAEAQEPFFVYLHYLDPHGPYEPLPKFRALFDTPEAEDPLHIYRDVRNRARALEAPWFDRAHPRMQDVIARYDAEIAYVDHFLQRFLDGLAEQGQLENTIIVLTADHGEEFLEHGFVEHGWTLYDEVIRVPLIFWQPRVFQPAVVDTPVAVADTLPSLLEATGRPVPPQINGRSQFAMADGRVHADAVARPIISEFLVPLRGVVRTVIDGGWKYHAQYRQWPIQQRAAMAAKQERFILGKPTGALPVVDIWGAPAAERLYHLDRDPNEQHNQADTAPEKLAHLRTVLADYLEQARQRRPANAGSAPPPQADEEELEELRALGYL